MKRMITFLAICICSMTFSAVSYAAKPEYIIDSFMERIFPHWKQLIALEEGEILTSDMLPPSIIYNCNDGGYALSVNWEIDNEALSEPGLHYVKGHPVIPDDAVLADGFNGIVTWPVFRNGKDAVLPVTPEAPEILSPLVSQNGNPESELSIYTPNEQYYIGDDGFVFSDGIPVWNWDYSAIDLTTPGAYAITGYPTFPEGYVLEAGYLAKFTVFVLPTDRIEIFAATAIDGRGSRLNLQWIYKGENVTDPVLEMETIEEEWVTCDTSWYDYQKQRLILYIPKIPSDITYHLRLRYQDVVNGESVERITEPVYVMIPSDVSDYIDPSALVNGNRDGSNDSEETFPDYTQPAPESTPNQDTVMEIVTKESTVMTGNRLDTLTSESSMVLFEKDGVSLEIPSALLDKLNLTEHDLFEVIIEKLDDMTVKISAFLNGKPVHDLSGSILYIPVTGTTDVFRLEIDKPGTYSIPNTWSPSKDTKKESIAPDDETSISVNYLWIPLVILLPAILILLKRRWRHE